MAKSLKYCKTVDQHGNVIEMTPRPFEDPPNGEWQTLSVSNPDTERINPYLAKKCPFCGSRPDILFEDDSDAPGDNAEIECGNPECSTNPGPKVEAQDVETALKIWNARHGETRRSMTPKQEECLEEALESLTALEQPPMDACDVKYQDSHQEAIESIKKHLQMALEGDEDAITIKLQQSGDEKLMFRADFGEQGMEQWNGTAPGHAFLVMSRALNSEVERQRDAS